ncbi:MAG: DNA mismatch repair protein MutS, partial [Clostridia bacterium]|nr:DNA mismatch repair protein MutS [Clostridia bacterium]
TSICTGLDTLDDMRDLIEAALVDDPPVNVRDGGAIRPGFDKVADGYREMSGNGRKWLSELESREREETGIKTLKVGYNRVFGYYIEVSKSLTKQVPERFIRKQTLVNSERYFTEELKMLEEQALSAEENCIEREVLIFSDILNAVNASLFALQKNAELISKLDVYLSYAKAAVKNGYVRPSINENGVIKIEQGRHPMVENNMKESFNPNDILADNDQNRVLVITGPNMAGKSTYMRQTAILVLMAHIGCFVPAKSAQICMVDRIFTRVGASDNLSSGQSTFMVEMSEMACILNAATKNSLIILDEIGRGTATYDGLSIAWAVLEHIISVTGAKTMFATHYHELTSLEDKFDCIKNYSVAVKEVGDSIIFLHKIIPTGADKSFGIQVAALAGLPESVIARAKLILREHEGLLSEARQHEKTESEDMKKRKVAAEALYEEVAANDPEELSPKEALAVLFRLKAIIEESER